MEAGSFLVVVVLLLPTTIGTWSVLSTFSFLCVCPTNKYSNVSCEYELFIVSIVSKLFIKDAVLSCTGTYMVMHEERRTLLVVSASVCGSFSVGGAWLFRVKGLEYAMQYSSLSSSSSSSLLE